MRSGAKWKWKQVGKSADVLQKPTFLLLYFIFILQKFNIGTRK